MKKSILFKSLFFALFISCSLKSSGKFHNSKELLVCDENIFNRKCFVLYQEAGVSVAEAFESYKREKPKRAEDAFLDFTWGAKINYLESESYARRACRQINSDVDYFELTYNKNLGVVTSGSLKIWCKKKVF